MGIPLLLKRFWALYLLSIGYCCLRFDISSGHPGNTQFKVQLPGGNPDHGMATHSSSGYQMELASFLHPRPALGTSYLKLYSVSNAKLIVLNQL